VYLRSRLDQLPPIPANLQAGSPPMYFDVSTDGVIVPPVSVCIDTRGMSFANAGNVRLYQSQESGGWADITSSGYPQSNQLCGQSDSLGTFAIFYPQVPATTVQTIAGNGVLEGSNDGVGGNPIDDFVDGPATATALNYLQGGAYDRINNHLFVSAGGYILRLNLNDNTIARVAGNGVGVPGSLDGPGGDLRDDLVEAGDAFNTYVGFPAELALNPAGEVVFFDLQTCRIRKLNLAQGRLFGVAGNGVCGFSGEGLSAGLASITHGQMAFDAAGNLFLANVETARVRRIDAHTNIIDTVVGDGTFGSPGNGAPALSTIGPPTGIAFDSQGHLFVAGSMHLIRVSTGAADALVDGDDDEIISIIGGCSTDCQVPFNGDGLAVSNPQVYLPATSALMVAQDGALIFPDHFRIRRVTPGADGLVTGASDEIISTIGGYADSATASQASNFNGDTFSTQSRFGFAAPFVVDDMQGRIIVVDGHNYRVRRFGLAPPPVTPGSVDLSISATGTPDPVNTDADLAYVVSVTNNGPAGATGVTMVYVIPAGAEFQSAVGSVACTTPTVGARGTVTCNFGTLASGASGVVTVTVRSQTAGSLASTFDAAAVEVDPNAANNSTTVTTTVTLAPAVITVNEIVLVSDTVGLLPSAMIGVTETVTVADALVLLPSAMIGVTETVIVTDSPLITVPGGSVTTAGVPVPATDPNGDPTPVTVTFAAVNAPGFLTAQIVTSPLPAPNGYIFLTPVYDVVTTASVTAPIDVCFSGWGFTAQDKVMHFESGAWADRTDSSSSSATLICGRMASLSPVVVVRPTSTIVPMPGSAFIAPPIAVHLGAGDQNDPHVSNDLVSYTNNHASAGRSGATLDCSTTSSGWCSSTPAAPGRKTMRAASAAMAPMTSSPTPVSVCASGCSALTGRCRFPRTAVG
jgi:uncharacterized repeat protein (TIGR01451 family)